MRALLPRPYLGKINIEKQLGDWTQMKELYVRRMSCRRCGLFMRASWLLLVLLIRNQCGGRACSRRGFSL